MGGGCAMTDDERWKEIEECFDSIVLDVQHRCYSKHSVTGAMYLAALVRRHLAHIDVCLASGEMPHPQHRETVAGDKIK